MNSRFRLYLLILLTSIFTNIALASSPPRSFAPPIMGWSSWNTYRVHISDSLIRYQAKAMVDHGLKEAGYNYINIDDGFFGYRDKKGLMHTNPERFPNGLKGVADYIHSLGLKAGIYSDAGANTCGSIWDKDKSGIGSGLYGHERIDADLYFNQWGFDFIKIDYCGAGQELNLDEQKRYTEIYDTITKVANRPISINICRWAFPGTWAKDIATSWRISGDIAANWGSIKHIIGKNLYLSGFTGNGHYNDMDMLEIGRGLPMTEEETHFGIWCIMSSPLLIGCDLGKIPEASLRLLRNKELIALNQDPLGLQAYVVDHTNGGYVLTKDIETLRGNTRAVALYNPMDQPLSFDVDPKLIDLEGPLQMRDLIQQKDLPVAQTITMTVPAHGVKVLRVQGAKRLDRIVYEAETAYMPCYHDLKKTDKDIAFVAHPQASGQMTVKYLGGRPENVAEWNDVYVSEGGKYEMTIAYLPTPLSGMQVTINGTTYDLTHQLITSSEIKNPQSTTIIIPLKQGRNRISIGSPYSWVPTLDYFSLKRHHSDNKTYLCM